MTKPVRAPGEAPAGASQEGKQAQESQTLSQGPPAQLLEPPDVWCAEDPLEVERRTLRMAQELLQRGRRTFGVAPSHAGAPTGPLGLLLARAMANLRGGPLGFIPAWDQWPSFWNQSAPGDFPAAGGESLLTHPLGPRLVRLVPSPPQGEHQGGHRSRHGPRHDSGYGAARRLEGAIVTARQQVEHLVLDLAGLAIEQEPDLLTLMDGVVLVGRAGATNTFRLRETAAKLPAHKNLGFILAD